MVSTDVLSKAGLFAGLGAERLARIGRIAQRGRFEAGETVLREGDLAASLYILEEGRVSIILNAGGREIHVQTIAPGEVFAWSALVEPHRSTASVRADSESIALAVSGHGLRRIFADDPELGCTVMDRLAALISVRLNNTRFQLAEAVSY